jgi:hypothetical protein
MSQFGAQNGLAPAGPSAQAFGLCPARSARVGSLLGKRFVRIAGVNTGTPSSAVQTRLQSPGPAVSAAATTRLRRGFGLVVTVFLVVFRVGRDPDVG